MNLLALAFTLAYLWCVANAAAAWERKQRELPPLPAVEFEPGEEAETEEDEEPTDEGQNDDALR